MHSLFDILIPLSLAVVAGILLFGIFTLFKGGSFARSYSNKLMRARVVAQAVAILVLCAAVYWRQHGGAH
jgi:hypothetical protein